MPSRLVIYFNERALEGTVGSDSANAFLFADCWTIRRVPV